MKYALVYFGTKSESAYEEIVSFKREVEKRLDIRAELFFSSPHFKGNKFGVPVLEKKQDAILSLFVENGNEYRKLLSYSDHVSPPLILDHHDIISLLADEETEKGKRYILTMHGSSDESCILYKKAEEEMGHAFSIVTIKGGTLSYQNLTFEEKKGQIIPFLITLSHHAENNIDKDMKAFYEKMGKDIRIEKRSLLSRKSVRGLFITRFKTVIDI